MAAVCSFRRGSSAALAPSACVRDRGHPGARAGRGRRHACGVCQWLAYCLIMTGLCEGWSGKRMCVLERNGGPVKGIASIG